MDGIKIPSIKQMVMFMVMLLIALFVIRLLPENIRKWFTA